MSGNMVYRRNYSEQMSAIDMVLKAEIEALDALPPKEARKKARTGLKKVGIMNRNGKLSAPYVALMK